MTNEEKNIFFSNLSIECNTLDIVGVKNIYYGLLRFVTKHIKNKGPIELPDWGTFEIGKQKSKIIHNVKTRTFSRIEEKNRVKFVAERKMKQYFNM